jgi:hypothetical protein
MFETLSTKNAGIGLRDAVSSITAARRPGCRSAGDAADQVRICHQSEEGQDSRLRIIACTAGVRPTN